MTKKALKFHTNEAHHAKQKHDEKQAISEKHVKCSKYKMNTDVCGRHVIQDSRGNPADAIASHGSFKQNGQPHTVDIDATQTEWMNSLKKMNAQFDNKVTG
jgi:hypothetical protein